MKFTKIIKADENINSEALEIYKNAKAKAEQIAAKYGYEVDCSGMRERTTEEHPFREIRINAERFWPEGWVRYNWYGIGDIRAEIQTTAYGPLNLEEYAEYLDHCHKALECLKELKETFFK